MTEILAATMSRTGAPTPQVRWDELAALCRALPHRVRLVGVFRGPGRTSNELLGYALAYHHGERAVYNIGASLKVPDIKIRMMTPALWDLILWAHREGARWFDFGGVTTGTVGTDDPLGGISDFKRGFTREEIALGEEWVFEPRPWKARVANAASRLARRMRRALRPSPPAAGGTRTPAPGGEEESPSTSEPGVGTA
jgi:hypothetical protein